MQFTISISEYRAFVSSMSCLVESMPFKAFPRISSIDLYRFRSINDSKPCKTSSTYFIPRSIMGVHISTADEPTIKNSIISFQFVAPLPPTIGKPVFLAISLTHRKVWALKCGAVPAHGP